MNPQRAIGVDLGGTKILAGVVGRDGSVEERREWPTPLDSQEELLQALARRLRGAAVAAAAVPAVGAVARGRLRLERHPPAHPAPAVDAVGLLFARHPAEYRSRGPWHPSA